MPAAQPSEAFLAQAERLGHDRATLLSKGEHSTTITVNSIEELRNLMQPTDPTVQEQRKANVVALAAGRPLTLAEHIEAYLHGNHEIPEEYLEAANAGFPVTVNLKAGGGPTPCRTARPSSGRALPPRSGPTTRLTSTRTPISP